MSSLESDANLDRARQFEGYKVLPPCVLYGKIGQGGMGAVYRGRHLNLDIDVAVKCLKPDLTGDDDQFVVRFRREARSAARINHQNVVRVFDVSEEKGLHYIVMELVQGETARQRVQRKKELGIGEALEILYGAASGLGEAHSKGFIHRDVKPDNIMISASGQVKVADLGLAKPSGASNLSMLSGTNMVMGTPQYMPPEQWENTATVTPAADVWALGATLYYLLVGGEAIAKDSLPRIMQRIVMQAFPDVRESRPDCPEDVALLIARATDRDPEKRFADAREMAQAIERLATRRDALSDCETVMEGDQNTLLSPPPAKTLAKIKFWLDEQATRGGGGEVETMPAAGRATTAGAGATIVQPTQATPAPLQPARRGNGGLLAAVLVLLLGAAAVFVWQPWKKVGVFAQADAYEKAGSFAMAVAEVERIHGEDPSLAGKAERLGRLYAAWARQRLDDGDLRQALVYVGQAIGYADTAASHAVERDVLQRLVAQLETALVRTSPGERPVARDQAVEFVGRLDDPLVRELRIAGRTAVRGADGAFALKVDLRGDTDAKVDVTLSTGRSLALAAWPVRYAAPVATGGPGPEEQVKPQVVTPPVVEPGTDAPGKKPEGPITSVLMPDAEFRVTPERLELVGDAPATLTIDAAAGAQVYVDGALVERRPGAAQWVYEVRSDLDRPADVVVEVQVKGAWGSRRTIPVVRQDAALEFAKSPEFVGLQAVRGGMATSAEALQVVGRVSVAQATLSSNGVVLQNVQWGADGSFTAAVSLPKLGENVLRLRAERRFHRPVEVELTAVRLGPPVLTLAGATRLREQVGVASYTIEVKADEWTDKITAGSGVKLATLQQDRSTRLFRCLFPLDVGVNQIPIRAVNALGTEMTITLVIERIASLVRPMIDDVEFRIDGRPVEVLTVNKVRRAFLRKRTGLFIKTNDPAAAVVIEHERTKEKHEVKRQADGSVSLELTEGSTEGFTIWLSNAVGTSEPCELQVLLDTVAPTGGFTTPAPLTVRKGQPFDVKGVWMDIGRLDKKECTFGGVQISPRFGGVSKNEETWTVRHPGLQQTTELQLVLTDLCGNKTTLPFLVKVQ